MYDINLDANYGTLISKEEGRLTVTNFLIFYHRIHVIYDCSAIYKIKNKRKFTTRIKTNVLEKHHMTSITEVHCLNFTASLWLSDK